MNKTKFYTIGLVAGSLFATSCDDRVDCGCDCNMPTFEKWEMLKPGEEKSADGTVSSGNAIVVWGKNLSDITAISFGGKNAELHPAYMEDNKIVFQVPENISKNCVAHVTTASCEQGFDVDMLSVVVAPPCVAMCDNEM
ncbi:MAG: IPT/TIG domain-containing protein, partial [Paludibacteraceae bacterium]|nr:IPT/TIG domain-containing protein [Paludibacteraceae bacterium]